MKKRFFPTELAYVIGIVAIALGVALMERADFGMSMVVAPAYVLYLKLSAAFPFVTFGMAEYALQAVLLLALTMVVRRFRLSYLFSFVTAVVYGFTLDLFMLPAALLPADGLLMRGAWYVLGMLACAIGVSMMFHTYLAPEAYELFVKELSAKLGKDIHKVKTVYDCVSCAVGIALSFAFFGLWHFEGVKLGTIVCALVNGWTISRCTRFFDARWTFGDALPLRKYFE